MLCTDRTLFTFIVSHSTISTPLSLFLRSWRVGADLMTMVTRGGTGLLASAEGLGLLVRDPLSSVFFFTAGHIESVIVERSVPLLYCYTQ